MPQNEAEAESESTRLAQFRKVNVKTCAGVKVFAFTATHTFRRHAFHLLFRPGMAAISFWV
jgi:hypothetical protein